MDKSRVFHRALVIGVLWASLSAVVVLSAGSLVSAAVLLDKSIYGPGGTGGGIEDLQATYAASHGGDYFQGVRTRLTPVSQEVTAVPNFSARPSDQTASWTNFGADSNHLPPNMVVWVSVYEGPSGKGYVVYATTVVSGVVYEKAVNFGPESWRSYDWVEIEP